MLLLALVIPTDCEAVERTAYLFRHDDQSLVSVPLPVPDSGPVIPTIIESFGWTPVGSTLHPDGRILTMNADTDELVVVTPATGEIEVLCTLSVDIQSGNDLFRGIDGSLMGVFQGEFHRIDSDSGMTIYQAPVDEWIEVITTHEGQYLAWGGYRFWRVDPQTFEMTLVFEIPLTPGGGHHPWGLTSVGGNLWTGISVSGMPPVFDTRIFTLDPFTGQYGEYVEYVQLVGDEMYTAIEVIEQPSPSAIPVLQPIGLVLLVLSFMVVGVLMSSRR